MNANYRNIFGKLGAVVYKGKCQALCNVRNKLKKCMTYILAIDICWV